MCYIDQLGIPFVWMNLGLEHIFVCFFGSIRHWENELATFSTGGQLEGSKVLTQLQQLLTKTLI